eukprot:24852-Eustigmatos_ZCMA.PRE.1
MPTRYDIHASPNAKLSMFYPSLFDYILRVCVWVRGRRGSGDGAAPCGISRPRTKSESLLALNAMP